MNRALSPIIVDNENEDHEHFELEKMLTQIKMKTLENKIKNEEVIIEKPEDEEELSITKHKYSDDSPRGRIRQKMQIENIVSTTLEEKKKIRNDDLEKLKMQDLREQRIKLLLKEEKLKAKQNSGPIINTLTAKAKKIKEGKNFILSGSNEGKDNPVNTTKR